MSGTTWRLAVMVAIVWVPCFLYLSQDASSEEQPSGALGSCDHDVHTEGGPLDPSCGACEAAVCAEDAYCCTTAWDQVCVDEVAQFCSGSGCDHDECTEGVALDPSCSECAASVCGYDPYCCDTQGGSWDDICVSEAQSDSACNCT